MTTFKFLSIEERQHIEDGLKAGKPISMIGYELKRPGSTIHEEVRRNGGKIKYSAKEANLRYESLRLKNGVNNLSSGLKDKLDTKIENMQMQIDICVENINKILERINRDETN